MIEQDMNKQKCHISMTYMNSMISIWSFLLSYQIIEETTSPRVTHLIPTQDVHVERGHSRAVTGLPSAALGRAPSEVRPRPAEGFSHGSIGRNWPFKVGLKHQDISWLVVWLPSILFSHILGCDYHPNWRTHIFQRGSNHQPDLGLKHQDISRLWDYESRFWSGFA